MQSDTSRERRRIPTVLVLAAGVLVVWLAAANFKDVVWYNLFPKRFGTVVPGEIYRSGKLTPAALTKVVREHEIKTVVDLGAWEEGSAGDDREAKTAAALGVERVRFNLVGDATGDPSDYLEALRIMTDPARQPVLVHCGAGTERTGCIVALYRMHADSWTLDEALSEAEGVGHSPRRNPHLREVLETHGPDILDAFERGGELEPGDEPGG